jgi:hypothetical protein
LGENIGEIKAIFGMNPDEIVSQLGRTLVLEDLHFSSEGTCRLRVDETITVDIEKSYDDAIIHLYSVVGKISHENNEKLYEQLLRANLFGKETNGFSLGVDSLLEEILLFVSIETQHLDLDSFLRRFEVFVDTTEEWIKRLESGSGGSDEESITVKEAGWEGYNLRA